MLLLAASCGKGSDAPVAESQASGEFLRGWATPSKEVDTSTGLPARITRVRDGMVMVLVPAGSFLMGAVPDDKAARDEEKPQHRVTLTKPYYLDEHEVTIAMWSKFAAATGARMPSQGDYAGDEHPIDSVTWDDATKYGEWVGAGLPTEAQWERAARGRSENTIYPWGDEDDPTMRNGPDVMHKDGSVLVEDDFAFLAPVRSFPPNDFGLYDMSGNVAEWCSDLLDWRYYAASPARDPRGPQGAIREHVVRSGGWMRGFGSEIRLRCSARAAAVSSARACGLRCAKTIP